MIFITEETEETILVLYKVLQVSNKMETRKIINLLNDLSN